MLQTILLTILAFYAIAWAPVTALMACAFVMRYHRATYDKWGNPDKAAKKEQAE